MERHVVLITGISSGIGRETALFLSRKGFKVYGATRNLDHNKSLLQEGVEVVYLDLANEESIKEAIRYILSKESRIDVLVNNSGFGIIGSIEETPIEKAKELFETNLFGQVRVINELIPVMRKQGKGKILNIVSVESEIVIPFFGWYSASKSAFEMITQTLRVELKPFGIDVVSIWPTGTKTKWFENAKKHVHTAEESPYHKRLNKVLQLLEKAYLAYIHPLRVSKVILKVINSRNTKPRYVVSFRGKLSMGIYRISRLLGLSDIIF